MRLSLVGMSGTGKTHWSKQLESKGFRRFGCDENIESKLRTELARSGLPGGINDVSRWMGQPYEERYTRNSRRYLELEAEAMEEIFGNFEHELSPETDLVIDTTGSVIYVGEPALNRLSSLTTIIYLETPLAVQKEMFKLYHEDPKPVIWGDRFKKREGESNATALERCYPELLAFRSRRFAEIAEVTLDYQKLRSPGFSVDDFIAIAGK